MLLGGHAPTMALGITQPGRLYVAPSSPLATGRLYVAPPPPSALHTVAQGPHPSMVNTKFGVLAPSHTMVDGEGCPSLLITVARSPIHPADPSNILLCTLQALCLAAPPLVLNPLSDKPFACNPRLRSLDWADSKIPAKSTDPWVSLA